MASATKIDYKRELRELYAPSSEPAIVDVPELSFLMIDGHGDPNSAPAYSEAIEALYTLSYTAKFALKRSPAGLDFAVMPLEGLWWTPDMASFSTANKAAWDWTVMIMQPEQVSEEVFEQALQSARSKKQLAAFDRLRLESFAEGLSAQVMFIGPYAEEGPTIQRLHAFIAEQGYELAGKHHEIYLSDPRRCAPEKLKTIIRQPIAAT